MDVRLNDLDPLTLAQKRNYFLRGSGDNSEWEKTRRELLSVIHCLRLNQLDENSSCPGRSVPFSAAT